MKNERGSVTAELAISLPAVFLVLGITLGAFALQIERMKLVDVAASAARALARGEPEVEVKNLIEQLAPSALGTGFQLRVEEDILCVRLVRSVAIPGLGGQLFDLTETQCARKVGL